MNSFALFVFLMSVHAVSAGPRFGDECHFKKGGVTHYGRCYQDCGSPCRKATGRHCSNIGEGGPVPWGPGRCCNIKKGTSAGDPFVEGFAGQKYNFNPRHDGWYAAISDSRIQVNLKVHGYKDLRPAEQAEAEFYTGVAIQYFDEDNDLTQSLLIEVRDTEATTFDCSDLSDSAPNYCLGGGGVDIFLNGNRVVEPMETEIATNFHFSGANVSPSCQKVSDTQLLFHPNLASQRELTSLLMFEEFLTERDVLRPLSCEKWISMAKSTYGDLFKVPGTKSTIRFQSGHLVSVIEYDTHLTPKESGDDLVTFRIGYSAESYAMDENLSEGYIGETAKVRVDTNGEAIMQGNKVIKTDFSKYMVDGPFGRDFEALYV